MRKLQRMFGWFFLVVSLLYGYKTYYNVQTVLTYRSMVQEVLAQHEIKANEDLVLAMIYTETKGQHYDIMQSSESLTGVINSITDSRESIKQGASVLATNLAKAEELDVDRWSAVQAYNFGTPYIQFVSENGGQSTIPLAKQYSKEIVAPSLGNVTGESYRYYNPIALFYGGGELYKNGGNIYYAKEVHFNLYLIRLFSEFDR